MKKGDYNYIIAKYVDRDFWLDISKNYFQNMYIENFTDFNYSTCFTMYLNISDSKSEVGTEEFKSFIKQNLFLYRIKIQISVIAPYAMYKFVQYDFKDGKIRMKEKFNSFIEKHSFVEKKVIEFLNMLNLTILYEDMLSVEIPNVSLEMKKTGVTIYNCLFEDEY